MRPLIEHGYVYMAQPPLYRIKLEQAAEHEFVYSDRERDALLADGHEPGQASCPRTTRSSATRVSVR